MYSRWKYYWGHLANLHTYHGQQALLFPAAGTEQDNELPQHEDLLLVNIVYRLLYGFGALSLGKFRRKKMYDIRNFHKAIEFTELSTDKEHFTCNKILIPPNSSASDGMT